MAQAPVPATTSIRRSRVGNIDTDRLQRRHDFIWDNRVEHGRAYVHTNDLRMRAAELRAIRDELARRAEEGL